MAGAGAKKRLEENTSHIRFLQIWLAVGFLSFLLLRMVYFGGYASKTLWFALVSTTLIAYFCYRGIATLAAATYGARGELLDAGADMSMKGFCGHYHDLLYMTVIVQVGASISSWFWYAYLIVPGYGLWKLTELVLIPYWKSSGKQMDVVDEESRKKMERAQARAQRRAQKWR